MPSFFAQQLSEAISDALNPQHGIWNLDFRVAVGNLPGENNVFYTKAKNLSPDGPFPATVLVTAESLNKSVNAHVVYVADGIRDVNTPVQIV